MNRNDIRPALVGVTAGALTMAGLAAVLEYDVAGRVADRIERARMSPAQRAESDALAARIRAHHQQVCARIDADRARRREAFRPELVTTVDGITALEDFTVEQLITEIRERRRLLRRITRAGGHRPEDGRTDFQTCVEQLGALREEFDHRRWRTAGISRLDQRRLDAAAEEVHGPGPTDSPDSPTRTETTGTEQEK
ncbi:hypothetical protein ACTD5D_31425 [Nocardia takedensis]|uniref:hypothetical protein n=1 Tax=Nocardia takedensis TaxID=259390 RepID=UPI003F7708F5